jgi:hypothetical protein
MANKPFDPMAPMQAQVNQQQRMADVMRMQSLQPIQNVGASPLSHVSPFQALAQVMGAYASNKMQDRATQGQADMVKAMQEHTNQGLEQYMTEYQEDPRGAVMRAMSSSSPVVRAMATQELKGLMTPKSLAAHATDASVIGSNGNAAQFQAKRDLKTVEPGKPLMDEQGQLVVPTIQPGAGQTLETINGDLYGRTPTGVDQINKAPRVTTTTTLHNHAPVGETAFEKRFGEREAMSLSDHLQQRPGKIEGISAAQEGLKLLEDGIHTGLFADMKKNLDKGYGLVSGREPEKAARTERFIAHIGNLVIPRLKDFGGSDTVEEMKYLQKIMAGDITMEPKTLRNVLQSWQQKYESKIAETDRAVEAIRNRGNTLPTIDRGVQQEAQPQSGVMSFDDYVNNLGK